MRIACVQNGNFTEAHERLANGGFEIYGGQRYTVDAFMQFVGRHPHLVVSLDAPPHKAIDKTGVYLSVGEGSSLWGIPRRIS